MQFKGRSIPDVSSEERGLLKQIRSDSTASAQWRDVLYAVMNQHVRGANYQKQGVALRALSSSKDDSQIGPITIYSAGLDEGNVVELAIDSGKLADALRVADSDTESWMNYLVESAAHAATPKTSLKYPRVGISTSDELVAILDAWSELVAEREWSRDVSRAGSGKAIAGGSGGNATNPVVSLDVARVEKAAQDAGFDLSASVEGEWSVFHSTAFPQALGIASLPDGGYRLGLPDAVVGRQIGAEFGIEVAEAAERWAILLTPVPDYQTLYEVISRVAAMCRVVAGAALKEFEQATRKRPDTTEAVRLVVQRVGQDIFRKSLLDYWGRRCSVSGLAVPQLLRASHIKPWADCDSDAERLDVFNGLLLAPHVDALFDGGWVTFSDAGEMLIVERLDAASRDRLNLSGTERILGLTDRHCAYLAWHREHRFGRMS